jgi:hypothetical protein
MAEGGEGSLERRLAAIEAEVDAGHADLAALGFWRIVGEARRDPSVAERIADRAGRIDRAAFERAVRLRFPVWLGNLVLALGTVAGAAGIVVAMRAGGGPVAGLGLLFAAGAWSVSVHGLAHWAVGRVVGISFTAYFFRPGQFPPRPGIKTDHATYLRTPPGDRAAMHAAGALATKIAPFAALALWPLTEAPAWAAWGVLALGAIQIATDVLFSTRTGDWSRVRRERRAARELAARSYTRPGPGSSGQPG